MSWYYVLFLGTTCRHISYFQKLENLCLYHRHLILTQYLEGMSCGYGRYDHISYNGDALKPCFWYHFLLTSDRFFYYGPFPHITDIWTAYPLNYWRVQDSSVSYDLHVRSFYSKIWHLHKKEELVDCKLHKKIQRQKKWWNYQLFNESLSTQTSKYPNCLIKTTTCLSGSQGIASTSPTKILWQPIMGSINQISHMVKIPNMLKIMVVLKLVHSTKYEFFIEVIRNQGPFTRFRPKWFQSNIIFNWRRWMWFYSVSVGKMFIRSCTPPWNGHVMEIIKDKNRHVRPGWSGKELGWRWERFLVWFCRGQKIVAYQKRKKGTKQI